LIGQKKQQKAQTRQAQDRNTRKEGELMSELTKELKLEMLNRMMRSRFFEEAAIAAYDTGEFPGSAHVSILQEAGAVGACVALEDGDYMIGTHRSHGHSVANNADVNGLMAELFGKVTGVNRGKGGSMHLADKKVGSLGETSIVGSGAPIACGAGLSAKLRGTDQVALVFFGDGASNEGAVHEAMNLAAAWNLPVIFALENNGVAVTTVSASAMKEQDLYKRAAGYGIPGEKVDGQDVVAVFEVVKAAVDRARQGEGPSLVEIKTYRAREHAEGALFRQFIKDNYRDPVEHDNWLENRDPIKLFSARLIEEGVITADEFKELEATELKRIEDAVAFAKESPFPDPAEAFTGVYSTPLEA